MKGVCFTMEEIQEIVEKDGAGMRATPEMCEKKEEKRVEWKSYFSTKRIALMAVFVALAFAISFLEIPLFSGTPVFFLQIDFGNVFILLISFLLGPIEGTIVCVLKETLRIFGSSTGGVGELANMLMTIMYILVPSMVYKYRKGIKTVVLSLAIACVVGTVSALLVNRFITFPLFGEVFLKQDGVKLFLDCFWIIVAFNLIKTVSISILTLLLYKRLSNFIKSLKI